MNTRRQLLLGLGAGLLIAISGSVLASDKAAASSVPESPEDVVRAYVAARVRHDASGQYALFSAADQSQVPFAQFDTAFAAEKAPLSHAADDGLSPILAAVSVFFMDSHGSAGYQLTVAGTDPSDPEVVLVHAQPPGVPADKAFLLKIVTSVAPNAARRLNLIASYRATNPQDAAKAQEHAEGLTSISNLRQIGLALIMYAQAHGDHLPDADGWVDALLPQWKAFDKDFPAERLFRDSSAGQPWNYAFNRNLSGVRLGDIKDPAVTVLVFESTAGVKNAADTGQSLPRPGRHAGGDYYVFANGHAQWYPDGTKLSYRMDGK